MVLWFLPPPPTLVSQWCHTFFLKFVNLYLYNRDYCFQSGFAVQAPLWIKLGRCSGSRGRWQNTVKILLSKALNLQMLPQGPARRWQLCLYAAGNRPSTLQERFMAVKIKKRLLLLCIESVRAVLIALSSWLWMLPIYAFPHSFSFLDSFINSIIYRELPFATPCFLFFQLSHQRCNDFSNVATRTQTWTGIKGNRRKSNMCFSFLGLLNYHFKIRCILTAFLSGNKVEWLISSLVRWKN